jgi:transcriptional regulator with XRE-family HTH domain
MTKKSKTVCGELQALRLEMGYSMAEMAELLAVPKATYQGYENGSRSMPPGFINRVREWQQIDLEFMATLPQRVDERVAAEFPMGIMSE